MRLIAKFGGTSLATGARIELAADAIIQAIEDGHEVAVVVSAMGSMTDELLEYLTFDTGDADTADVLGMGERTSARLVAAALRSRGVDATVIEPGIDQWPIVVDRDDQIQLEETTERSSALQSLLHETVPVITGFLAEDANGVQRTLGRGGSDTTAMVLGNTLDTDRVVIVTDVEGVLTGNPDIIESTHNVGEISVGELSELSFRGAEVIAPEAIAHKVDEVDVEIVHYQTGDLLTSGTHVEGAFETIVSASEAPLSCLTVAGREIRRVPGILGQITTAVAADGITIDAISSGIDSVSLYLATDDAPTAKQRVHDVILEEVHLSSITIEDDLAAIRVVMGSVYDQPGVIDRIVSPLASANINIHELTTSATSITVFVRESERETALETVQQAMNALHE